MGARIGAHDWAATPLGISSAWPQSLRAALSICLHSAFPTAIYWGPDLRLFYNDAYAPVLADRHPWALGRPAHEVWADVWNVIEPQVRQVTEQGKGFTTFDQLLPLKRGGRVTTTYWNYSFTPLYDDQGAVAGIFNQGHEVTDRVLAERRGAFLLSLSDRLRGLSDPRAIIAAAQEALGLHLGASRVGYGEVDASARYFTTERNWTDGETPSRAGTHDLAGFGPQVHAALRAGTPLLIPDITADPRTCAPDSIAAFDAIDTRAVITASLVKDGRMRAALYVHARQPQPWTEADAALVTDVAERTWSAVERARAETESRLTDARLRAVFDAVPVGIVMADAPSGRIVGGNAQAEQIFGHPILPSPNMRRYADWHGFHPDGRKVEPHEYPLARALAGEEHPELEVLYGQPDGSRRWVRLAAAPIRDDDGAISGGVVACLDIDRKRRTEQALRALNETLEAKVSERTAERDRMWRLTTDVMLVARMDGLIQAVNPAWGLLLGWHEHELIGAVFLDLVHPDDREATVAEVGRLAEGATTFRFENRYRCKDGSYRTISWTAVPAEGLIHAVGRDVTAERAAAAELAQAQEALRQSQKLESMGQLTGGVAHDFNNLLTPIIGGLDMLKRRAGDDPRSARLLDGALQSAERAKTLVQRLLAFARRQPLQPVPVDIAGLAEGMVDLLVSTLGPKVKVEVDVAPRLPAVKADPNQLEMALLNLGVNARDAMPDGGTLTIAAGLERIGPRHRSKLPPGEFVRLAVSDTGVGMDAATAARAIEPFFSTKGVGQGTGLGLSMVHGLTAQLGGALTIDSAPGAGTTVELWLPVAGGLAEAAEAPRGGDAAAPAAAGTALLVDDEDLVRASAAAMLHDLGYEVVEARSAEEALRFALGASFDVVVTDHLMPGMSGVELARELRRRTPGLPVLVVSGYAESEGIASDQPRLTKPFRRDELAACLSRLRR